MYYKKLFWFFRAFFYKIFLKKILLPSYIGMPIYISGFRKILIGKNVRIFPGIRIEVFKSSRLIIEDNVGIAQNVQITCANSDLIISSGSLILANTFITNIDHNYENISLPILEQGISTKNTFIGKNCFIGIGCSIQAGTILGNNCIVGTNSVVRGVFPDYTLIVGSPARIIKKYNILNKKWEKV